MVTGAVCAQPGIQALAFSVYQGAGTYPKEMHIAVFDVARHRWKRAVIDCSDETRGHINCGSIVDLLCAKDVYYTVTHLTPSCGTTLVISHDFKPLDVLGGWPIAVFADGSTVYYKCQPHFAAVHPLELSLYNPRTNEDRPIYPAKPGGPVRRAHGEELRKVYAAIGHDWFRINNHPEDPERFSEYAARPVAVNDKADAIAFEVVYDGRDLDPTSPGEHRDKDVHVLCVYRHLHTPKRTEYREFRTEDLKKLVPFDKPVELVSRKNLDRIFALPYL
jgi:hypothetical protein